MTSGILIVLCSLLLIANVFDLTSARTRIPSVVLLLALGWGARQITDTAGITVLPYVPRILSVLGTVGLILIVLEGSLELELNRATLPLLRKAFWVALLPLLALALGLAGIFSAVGGSSLRESLINALPLCIISSAIAIPSARHLAAQSRAFVVYESSLSDILGILFFNFLVFNETIHLGSVGVFGLQLLLMVAVSLVATIGLAWMLRKLRHHIKATPIILLVVLIYALSKVYHLPGLLFILIFGLFLGNLDEAARFGWVARLHPEVLDREVHRFKETTAEATFVIRSLFFLLFGYGMQTAEIINAGTLLWAAGIVALIFLLRAVLLKISRLPLMPLLVVAPRGLITILLFVAIPASARIPLVNRSLIIQVVLLTALVMMVGMMALGKRDKESE